MERGESWLFIPIPPPCTFSAGNFQSQASQCHRKIVVVPFLVLCRSRRLVLGNVYFAAVGRRHQSHDVASPVWGAASAKRARGGHCLSAISRETRSVSTALHRATCLARDRGWHLAPRSVQTYVRLSLARKANRLSCSVPRPKPVDSAHVRPFRRQRIGASAQSHTALCIRRCAKSSKWLVALRDQAGRASKAGHV